MAKTVAQGGVEMTMEVHGLRVHATIRCRRLRHRLMGGAALWLAAASSWGACQLTQLEIPVHLVDRRPIATLKVNGTEVSMLVDSGAFYSMLNASTAAQLQLPLRNLPHGFQVDGYTGRIEVKRTRVAKLGLLGEELSNVEFLVGGNELGAGIQGILGRNILSVADTEYDLAHGAVRLSFPKGDCDKTNFAHWAGDAPVITAPLERPRSREDTAIRVEVRVNGTRTMALMDTGAPGTSLALDAARRAGISNSVLTPFGRTGGAGEGKATSWTGPVAVFELGGEKIANNRLEIDDVSGWEQDMLLGLDYFLSHRIYISRLQDKFYATWNGGVVFAQNQAAPDAQTARFAAPAQAVSADDADALARRGTAAMAVKDHARALADLDRACALAPGVASYVFARARLRLAMGQPALALADLDQALRLDATLAEARMRRVAVRIPLGDKAAALDDMGWLDRQLPPTSALRRALAEQYANLDQAAPALRQYDLWMQSHPNDAGLADVHNSRCWLRTRLNIELPLALQDCQQAIDLDPGDASNLDSLGWLYLRLGDARKAAKAFDGALKLASTPVALYGRGLARMRLNDATAGERDLATARQQRPDVEQYLRSQGFEFVGAAAQDKSAGS
jgi:predicted aspartyl protease/lipoprotein NlpI